MAAMPGPRAFWDGFYARHTWGERGAVNRQLVIEVEDLPPGRALDLGCGEGADAIWLGQRGWQVLGAEVSATAVGRARRHVDRLGLTDRVTVECRELTSDFPAGSFDLVTAMFLHSPVDPGGDRERILRRAAGAVGPGGHLLVVSHWTAPDWHPGMPPVGHPVNLALPTPEQNRAALGVAAGDWLPVRDCLVRIAMAGPDGQSGVRQDHVLHLRRCPANPSGAADRPDRAGARSAETAR